MARRQIRANCLALDHHRTPHSEQRWTVGVHVVPVRRLAPKTALPLLVTGALVGPGAILMVSRLCKDLISAGEKQEG